MRLLVLMAGVLVTDSALAGRAAQNLGFDSGSGSGRAPLTVRISEPPILMEKAKACQRIFGGLGFTVDWGDGSPTFSRDDKPDCQKLLAHTYSVAGKYRVKASVYHPGATDAPVTEWEGSAEVHALAGLSAGKPTVRILEAPGGQEIHYGQGFPVVKVFVQTTQKAELLAEIVTKNGKILFTEKQDIAFSGETFIQWNKYENGPSADEYRNDRTSVKVRVTLLAAGKVLDKAESAYAELLGSITFRTFAVKPESGKAPLTIMAVSAVSYDDCYSYIVDWGDGSADDKSEGFVPRKQCALRSGRRELSHVYSKPGSYRIRWFDNNVSPFGAAQKAPGFMEKRMLVTR